MKFSRVTAAIVLAAMCAAPLAAKAQTADNPIAMTKATVTIVRSSDHGVQMAKTYRYVPVLAGIGLIARVFEQEQDLLMIDSATPAPGGDFVAQLAIYDTSEKPTATLGTALVFGETDPVVNNTENLTAM
jgi:hypothetical protein